MKGLSGKRVEIPSMEEITQERKRLFYRRRYKRVLKSTAYALVVVAAIAVLLATNLLPVLQVSGDSMNPILQDQDILVLLRSARMASAGDSADTLGADAGDLLLAVEMDYYKYLPVYASDPSYQGGDHREASLRHLFKCRRMDHLRRQTRQQQYIGYHLEDPLGDEDGGTRGSLLADPALSDPADLLEHRQPEKVLFYKLDDGTYVLDIPEMAEIEQTIDVTEMFK